MWNTSIAFPQSVSGTQDSAGFVRLDKTYLHGIPANRKDTTRSDETLANNMGYTVDRVYEVDRACYNGAGYLIDEFENVICDIKRVHTQDKSNLVSLACEVRENGKV